MTWSRDGNHPFHGVPVFVLTHALPAQVPRGATPFPCGTDGIASALTQVAAGDKAAGLHGASY
jgi:hypothetical protein